jgi:hypothetical protein
MLQMVDIYAGPNYHYTIDDPSLPDLNAVFEPEPKRISANRLLAWCLQTMPRQGAQLSWSWERIA